jgi:hypothetical protein
VLAAFAATNASGYDNGTLLTNTSAPPDAPGSTSAPSSGRDDSNSSAPGVPPQQQARAASASQLLSLSGQPAFLVPLKVVMGISSSFITNAVQPAGELARELTGTEVLK